ncbi:MAG: glycosyltransferase, partial [Betaproteobacteria bacterium]|nr:glycosyltransferase [Betaproteobacteria bacterium]
RLPAAATITLPRWGLIGLCLLYILPGIIRRDPWKTDDAAGFGVMWTMAHGTMADWLSPNIVGLPMPNDGPLAFWIGAILIKLFGWIAGDALAARLSILVFFAIGAASVWRAAYVLGGRGEAQPLKLAFGGQPAALDYGRTLADGALLIYMACLGLLLRSHETATPALHVALVAASFYAAACVFDRARSKDALLLGVALGLLVLTRGWTVPLGLLMAMLLLAALRYQRVLQQLVRFAVPIALLIPLAWVAAHALLVPADQGLAAQWMNGKFLIPGGPALTNIRFVGKTVLWQAWPAWPIALWAIYAWRTQVSLHILLPAAGIAPLLLLNLAAPVSRDVDLLPLLPPLAILATFGLPTLKRGAINAIDWFSVMTLSAIAAFIWLGWIAKQTGWPAQLAKNAFKLAPGFKPEFNLIALLIALASSVGWALLLQWRLGRRPPVLWRAVVLSTGGLVLCWLLLMTLWLPWLNYGQSYADVAHQINTHLPGNYHCVNARGVGPAQRASFAYLGEVRFSKTADERCEFLLVQDTNVRKQRTQLSVVESEFTLLWQGRRASDRNESFRLFKRASP